MKKLLLLLLFSSMFAQKIATPTFLSGTADASGNCQTPITIFLNRTNGHMFICGTDKLWHQVGSASSGSPVQAVAVSLSSAQILNLATTAVVLVPPQGTNSIITPVLIVWETHSGQAYTVAGGSTIMFANRGGNIQFSFTQNNVLTSQFTIVTAQPLYNNDAVGTVANQPFQVFASAAPTVGTADAIVTVYYTVTQTTVPQ